MNEIGIMQGRLSPPPADRLQAFPWNRWEDEFRLAAKLGFDAIEWQLDPQSVDRNPLLTEEGVGRIRSVIAETGVRVLSVCADYFMPHPFFRASDEARAMSVDALVNLIARSAQVGARTILLPVLEEAEVRNEEEKELLLQSLRLPLCRAAECGIRLGLETELPADEYLNLVERANHPALGVYYDTGNSAARGYYIGDAALILGQHLCGVHLKDRLIGGKSVVLGEGAADFDGFFRALAAVGYRGMLVLQTAFGSNYLETAVRHLEFVRQKLRQIAGAHAHTEQEAG